MMKTISRILGALTALVLLASTSRAADAAAYLIVTVERHPYAVTAPAKNRPEGASASQSYKIALTDDFIARFKNIPSQDSMGTGLCISGGYIMPAGEHTHFMCWIRRTVDQRWQLNMWASGFESLAGNRVFSPNPSVSQMLTFRRWEDLDTRYRLSYNGNDHGVNVSFSAQYAKATDIDPAAIPTLAPTDNKEDFLDQPDKLTFRLYCSFQEG